ncbi:hypothetical protein, partial [Gordonia rhizosphera]|uniref:hypothetical protein n=1 Tax=Gordonia rhizosphera TaxID=83341 RepID=UPI001C3F440F
LRHVERSHRGHQHPPEGRRKRSYRFHSAEALIDRILARAERSSGPGMTNASRPRRPGAGRNHRTNYDETVTAIPAPAGEASSCGIKGCDLHTA